LIDRVNPDGEAWVKARIWNRWLFMNFCRALASAKRETYCSRFPGTMKAGNTVFSISGFAARRIGP